MLTKTPIPCLELPSKCFISSKLHHIRVSCKPDGELFGCVNYLDWEEWQLAEGEHGTVVLKSAAHGAKYLGSDAHGGVFTTRKPGNGELWKLEWSDEHSGFSLKSHAHERFLVYEEGLGFRTAPKGGPRAAWTLRFTSGELCFISSVIHNKRIASDPSGNTKMSNKFSGWEVWRFIEVGNGSVFINSCANPGFFLSSSTDGNVFTTKNREDWEKWNVAKSPRGDGVEMVSSAHGKRLACDESGRLYTTSNKDSGIVWKLDSANKSQFFVSSVVHNKFLAIGPDKKTILTTANRGDWEKWEVMKSGESLVSLRSMRNVFLVCNDAGELATSLKLDEKGLWDVQALSDNGVALHPTNHPTLKLACDKDGQLSTVSNGSGGRSTIWSFSPCMPELKCNDSHEQSGNKNNRSIRAVPWSVRVLAAAAGAVIAPFAVVGVVSALGFTAGGIASGSIAAGMMSAEAIASGGGVVAGGTVATLQSIGAAGLGIAGTTAAAGTGAAIGAGVSKVALSSGRPLTTMHSVSAMEGMPHSEGELVLLNRNWNRPFCAWSSW